jgi:hypothetical protein
MGVSEDVFTSSPSSVTLAVVVFSSALPVPLLPLDEELLLGMSPFVLEPSFDSAAFSGSGTASGSFAVRRMIDLLAARGRSFLPESVGASSGAGESICNEPNSPLASCKREPSFAKIFARLAAAFSFAVIPEGVDMFPAQNAINAKDKLKVSTVSAALSKCLFGFFASLSLSTSVCPVQQFAPVHALQMYLALGWRLQLQVENRWQAVVSE